MKIRGGFHQRNCKSDSGFTLVELLAVIAIIGLLASLALPAISKIRTRARVGAVKAQLAQIETAIEQYYADWDTYPPAGNDCLGGDCFGSEDVGSDGVGPFTWNGGLGQWVVNGAYTAPDTNGTEGNYVLDPGEDLGLDLQSGTSDIGEGNGRLDGTYYDRLGMFADADKAALLDHFATRDTYYHYYPGHVYGKTGLGMPKFRSYSGFANYKDRSPSFYNRWVLYSVGLDEKDHGLHNYYLVMQDGEDVGFDGYASDVMDDGSGAPNAYSDNDGIIFEPSLGENDGGTADTYLSGTVRETGWTTPGGMSEDAAPGGNDALFEGPKGEPIFSYDVRMKRRRQKAVFITPDGDSTAFGVIMRYGP